MGGMKCFAKTRGCALSARYHAGCSYYATYAMISDKPRDVLRRERATVLSGLHSERLPSCHYARL